MHVLHHVPNFDHIDILVGTETSDDAGVFRLRDDLAIVNTVDFFTPIVDDPYIFGQIAAANALSDIYAMGAEPRTALNIVAFPTAALGLDVLGEIVRGGAEKAKEAGAVVIGGHSIIDAELKYGMAVTGVIHPNRVIRNVGIQEGDALILTKSLGTGIVTTALKNRKASKETVRAAVDSMVALNRIASEVMLGFPVHACSDITGFGLLGHVFEMAHSSQVTAILEAPALPLLPNVTNLAARGHLTGGSKRNRKYLREKVEIDRAVPQPLVEVALDPQTSGGLLIAVGREHAGQLVKRLRSEHIAATAIVGHATARQRTCVKLIMA